MRAKQIKRCVMEASASSDTVDTPSRFFGSPSEPIYTDNQHVLTADLLQDALTLLSWKNDSALSVAQEAATSRKAQECTLLKSGYPILFLFELCKHFKLSSEVQYKAAELFYRFMINHIVELYQHVMASKTSSSPIKWDDVEKRLRHQVILRAISCVQLASKLGSHYHLVTLNRARSFLTSCGFRYAPISIVQSEIRVLKTLQYHVHYPTTLEYVEVLLGSLVHNNKTIPVKQLHALTLKILDIYHLRRSQIRDKLEHLAMPDADRKVGVDVVMATVENDQMLLASAVITAAGFILGQSHTKHVSGQLSQITCIVDEDIIDFASILLEEIFTEDCSLK